MIFKANRFGCDTIVLGSHRSNFVKRFFPGGTTKKILKQTKKQVFLVSLKKGEIDISKFCPIVLRKKKNLDITF